MTRPDISTLVDENGVPYEIEGYINLAERGMQMKIRSFAYDQSGWAVEDTDGNMYEPNYYEYIHPMCTLDEIKRAIPSRGFERMQKITEQLIEEAYELGRSEQ